MSVSTAALSASSHLIAAPVVVPLAAGALLVLLERVRPGWVAPVSLAAALGFLLVGLALVQRASGGVVEPYLMSNWPTPWGIAFALDRLSALMVATTAVLGSAAGWFVITQVFTLEWTPDWPRVLITVGVGAASTILLGLVGNWQALSARPAAILRQL